MKNAPLATGEIYHVYSKSLAGKVIFNSDREFLRMKETLKYYLIETDTRFSLNEGGVRNGARIVQIMAYCIMSTHVHLILKQLSDDGISRFMSRVLNSYTRYFNEKYKRKGTLYEGKFKRLIVRSEEYLLHLTRYIHLNPVTAYMVDSPEQWTFSSYLEYIGNPGADYFCDFKDFVCMGPEEYANFARATIDYQRSLAAMKHLLIDDN